MALMEWAISIVEDNVHWTSLLRAVHFILYMLFDRHAAPKTVQVGFNGDRPKGSVRTTFTLLREIRDGFKNLRSVSFGRKFVESLH